MVTKPRNKYTEQWFDSWQEQWIILFSLASLLALRAIQRAMEWVGGSFPPGHSRWGVNLVIKLHLVLRLWISIILPCPHMASRRAPKHLYMYAHFLNIFFLAFQATSRGTGRKNKNTMNKTNVQAHYFPLISCFSLTVLRETIQSTWPITFPDTERLPAIWARGSQKSGRHAIN